MSLLDAVVRGFQYIWPRAKRAIDGPEKREEPLSQGLINLVERSVKISTDAFSDQIASLRATSDNQQQLIEAQQQEIQELKSALVKEQEESRDKRHKLRGQVQVLMGEKKLLQLDIIKLEAINREQQIEINALRLRVGMPIIHQPEMLTLPPGASAQPMAREDEPE
jgi:hypothetical protein